MSENSRVSTYPPFTSFAQTGFPPELLQVTANFSQPTPIQSQCWPPLVAGRDVIGIAETGSGKTLTFGLPGLHRIFKRSTWGQKPTMLVLAPTRELAQQNFDVLVSVGRSSGIKCLCVFGGVEKRGQLNGFQKGVQVVVGCPGRILDLADNDSRTVDLSDVDYMVLDEADRMLDMGFEKDIRAIFGKIQPKNLRQTVMFGATWPKVIQQLAEEFLSNPVRITIGSEDLSANARVQQIIEVIDTDDRIRDKRLLELLAKYHTGQKEKVIIFGLYKIEAARLEGFLQKRGFKCISIHGNKSVPQRTEALESFKRGNPPLLIATDVAARGLHIPKVAYVINYSFPLTVEDYVHRIGRTGRAGATGISHTFFTKHDKQLSGQLIGVLRNAQQEVPSDLMAFGTTVKRKEPKLGKIDLSVTSAHITFDSDDE